MPDLRPVSTFFRPPNRPLTRRLRASVITATLGVALFTAAGTDAFATAEAPRLATTPQGSIELIAAAPVAPGDIWLGVRFRLEKRWHTYWRNPGDSGGPPTIRWTLPAGVSADPFVWPAPERIAVGPLVNYGYHGDLVLPVRLRGPAAALSKPFRIEAEIRWLVCKELCVPVRSRLALDVATLGVARTDAGGVDARTRQEWTRLIAAARRAEPRPAPTAWKATATADREHFTLTIQMDHPASSAVFFPLEESQVDDAAEQQVTVQGREMRLHLKTSDQLTAIPRILRGVLSLPSGEAVVIAAPVRSASVASTPRSSRRPS